MYLSMASIAENRNVSGNEILCHSLIVTNKVTLLGPNYRTFFPPGTDSADSVILVLKCDKCAAERTAWLLKFLHHLEPRMDM